MADVARRLESRSNPDVVRRLIARPIRLEHSRHVPPRPEPEALEPDAEVAASAAAERDVEQLEAELALLKAVLQAERAEAAELRARLADTGREPETDLYALRERWAALVDHLLLTQR